MSPARYFDEALSLFEALPSYHTDQLLLANRTVHLCTPSMDLRQRMLPSLAHLIYPHNDAAPKLTIWYADDQQLPRPLKAPPWQGFNAQGYNPDIDRDDVQLFFQPWDTQLFLYSRSRRTGIYWTQTTAGVPWWEATFSFRTIFHLWTRDLPAQLIHAGAMAKEGRGVLITGKSGSGKSTSCLKLLRAGYHFLGDDYVWVEPGEEVKVFSLYQTAKIEPDNLHTRFADWIPFLKNKEEYQQQKAVFHVHDLVAGAGVPVSTITAILLPDVKYQEQTHMVPASPKQALMAMAPTTLHHLPHHRGVSYEKLKNVAASLPAYHWHLGQDTEQLIVSLDNLLHNERAGY